MAKRIFRTVVGATALLSLAVGFALAGEKLSRDQFIASMKQGYAEAAKDMNIPNLFDVVEERFPNDLSRLADAALLEIALGKPASAFAHTMIAAMLVEIQSRDGEQLMIAPRDSLAAVISADRDFAKALAKGDPPFCIDIVVGTTAKKPPTLEIARGSAVKLVALLTAIADGRDHPVAVRRASDADYGTLAVHAKARGTNVRSWALLSVEKVKSAPPPEVCAAYISYRNALLAEPGDLGERLYVSEAMNLLTVDASVLTKPFKP
jgi:hypothetical protein